MFPIVFHVEVARLLPLAATTRDSAHHSRVGTNSAHTQWLVPSKSGPRSYVSCVPRTSQPYYEAAWRLIEPYSGDGRDHASCGGFVITQVLA